MSARARHASAWRPFSGSMLEGWLKEASDLRSGPFPTIDSCNVIADECFKEIMRAQDADLPIEQRRNVTVADIQAECLAKVLADANDLLASLEEFEPWLPSGHYCRERDGLPFSKLVDVLRSIPVSGVRRQPEPPERGRSTATWLKLAMTFGNLLSKALVEAGFRGSVDPIGPGGVVAAVGCEMLGYVSHNIPPDAETWAGQLGDHRKTRAKNPADPFPNRERLRGPYSPKKAPRGMA